MIIGELRGKVDKISKQIKFVRLIIDYIVDKGYLERPALQEDPFRPLASISELFEGA